MEAGDNVDPSTIRESSTNTELESTPKIPAEDVADSTTATSGVKRKRLPNDRVGMLKDEIQENPHNLSAWYALIEEYGSKGKHEELRETYEQMLRPFPYVPRVWVDYINAELAFNDFRAVEVLFSRCLVKVLSVDLWTLYLSYVRRINPEGEGQSRSTITQAYEFSINTIGMDLQSGPIWSDFIDFLRSGPAASTWEQQQKLDAVRRTYQRAVSTPIYNIEKLWRDYDAFENSVNRATARKFVAEKSPAYMSARAAMRELSNMTNGLRVLDYTFERKHNNAEKTAYARWMKWIEWEKNDPLDLHHGTTLQGRIAYAYEQAMLYIPLCPQIWLDAFSYFLNIQDEQRALQIMKRGMRYCPSSFVLHVRYAEHEEANGRTSDIRVSYEALVTALAREITAVEKHVVSDTSQSNQEAKPTAILSRSEKHKKKLVKQYSLAWCCLMNAIRRTEGIKAARSVFTKARKAPHQSHEIYIASALMEHHCSKDSTIASKIFELGLRHFSDVPDYIYKYLCYLISINDETNARALFEKAISKIDASDAKPIYQRWLDYESRYGDLNAAITLSQRMALVYPQESTQSIFLSRYGLEEEREEDEFDADTYGVRPTTESINQNKDDDAASETSDSSKSNVEMEDTRLLPASLETGAALAPPISAQAPVAPVPLPPIITELLEELPSAQMITEAPINPAKLMDYVVKSDIPFIRLRNANTHLKKARYN
ncbi:mRNA cleavage and polyadenylation specificity factor complex subunit Rna14 [Schizosaccharomyces cryophilus OY26]|uniref:mRNA 3'-end-processing protein RNA14 n=1 Tax=Schizosaccharomyces cryophilus (strain OY26 / ATCC MYA-4695 / CBS 11777 / NBRC 106824 / NRRL Y48691) TaxID=653667 RepID=S9XB00_SCHCR|nr:mRNA cleavage and polyadenylation specificity factor complex subunit Rna14 [Schizosaccharomyces cryophilus OY26]EPY50921.1 mRNA cleavage and polyadenylation specificity factor complex subunit Rna14 [Schizosaccharomyces cryophilus OY26]